MNGVAVEQVEETKLVAGTLDCKLSWSKHIDSMVVKIGRGLSVIKRCSAFLIQPSKKQVLQALVLSNLDYCPVVWLSAKRKDLVKLQLVQNRAARLALHCNQRADIQWGKKVFSQPPIVQVLPLKKMKEACNCHHRYTSTMTDKMREKNPENHIVGFLMNLFANYGGK